MLIMVGLRAAVVKEEHLPSLHLQDNPGFNGDFIANQLHSQPSKHNTGTGGVQTIQFVGDFGDQKIKDCMWAFQNKYPVLANQTFHTYGSDEELDRYVRSSKYATSKSDAAIYTAISFHSTGGAGTNGIWDYSIRGNASMNDDGTTLFTDDTSFLIDRINIDYDLQAFYTLMSKGHLFFQGKMAM
jgi:hypothetical protein